MYPPSQAWRWGKGCLLVGHSPPHLGSSSCQHKAQHHLGPRGPGPSAKGLQGKFVLDEGWLQGPFAAQAAAALGWLVPTVMGGSLPGRDPSLCSPLPSPTVGEGGESAAAWPSSSQGGQNPRPVSLPVCGAEPGQAAGSSQHQLPPSLLELVQVPCGPWPPLPPPGPWTCPAGPLQPRGAARVCARGAAVLEPVGEQMESV